MFYSKNLQKNTHYRSSPFSLISLIVVIVDCVDNNLRSEGLFASPLYLGAIPFAPKGSDWAGLESDEIPLSIIFVESLVALLLFVLLRRRNGLPKFLLKTIACKNCTNSIL